MASIRNFSESEPRKIGCNHVVLVGEARDELPELKRRSWETVKQQNERRIGRAGFSIEDAYAVRFNTTNQGTLHVCSPSTKC